jgi:hypothetical protein
MEEPLPTLPILDIHTHLVGGRLDARGLHDMLLYHMAASDLCAVGSPTGMRLKRLPSFYADEEAHVRIREALSFLSHVQTTSSPWAVRIVFSDLYRCKELLMADSWHRLDALICGSADDRASHHSVLDHLNIGRTGLELARRGASEDDDRVQYALTTLARFRGGQFAVSRMNRELEGGDSHTNWQNTHKEKRRANNESRS